MPSSDPRWRSTGRRVALHLLAGVDLWLSAASTACLSRSSWPADLLAASSWASFRACVIRFSLGYTACTSPMRRASSATWRPLSAQVLGPAHAQVRGRRCVPPKPGVMPRAISGWPNLAVLAAKPDVAGQRQLAAAAEGEPVDGRDRGCGAPSMAAHTPAPERREPPRLLRREHAAHLGDVGAGHERLVAIAGKHHGPHAPGRRPTARRPTAPSSSLVLAMFNAFSASGRLTVTTATTPSRVTSTAMTKTLISLWWAAIGPGQLYPTSSRKIAGRTGSRRKPGPLGRRVVAAKAASRGRAGGSFCRRPRPSRHPRPEGGSARPGGGRVLPRTLVSARRGPDRSRARFAVGGRVCFPLAHPAN